MIVASFRIRQSKCLALDNGMDINSIKMSTNDLHLDGHQKGAHVMPLSEAYHTHACHTQSMA